MNPVTDASPKRGEARMCPIIAAHRRAQDSGAVARRELAASRPTGLALARPAPMMIFGLLSLCATGCATPPASVPPPQLPDSQSSAPTEASQPPKLAQARNSRDPTPLEARGPAPEIDDLAGARRAIARGHADAALAWLSSPDRAAPQSDPARELERRLLAVRVHLHLGHPEQALEALSNLPSTPVAGGSAKLATLRAEAHLQLGQPDKARAALESASAAGDPSALGFELEINRRSGAPLPSSGRLRRAFDTLYTLYETERQLTPEQLLAVARAALAQNTTGGFKDANMVLAEGSGSGPASPGPGIGDEILLTHARLFLEKYDAAHAAELGEEVLSRDPWHPRANTLLGEVRFGQMQMTAAQRHFASALVLAPDYADAHAWLAAIDATEGRRAAASTRLDRFVFPKRPHHPVGTAVARAVDIFEHANSASDRSTPLPMDFGQHHLVLSELLGAMHLYTEVELVGRRAPQAHIAFARLSSVRGLNRLRLGREAEGLEDLERAWQLDPFNERTFNTRQLYRERIQNDYDSTIVTDAGASTLTLRVPKRQQQLWLPEVVEAARTTRRVLDGHYGIDTGPLTVEMFESSEDFAIRTSGVPQLGALGVCFGPVITMIGPHRGRHNLHAVLWHEMAHVYALALSDNRVPRWFTEGLSEWESELRDPSWSRESHALLRSAATAGALPPIAELEMGFLRARSPLDMELAYATAAQVVTYLGERFGRDALIAVLKGFAEARTPEELFESEFGEGLDRLQKGFDQWLSARLAAAQSGWTPQLRVDDDKARRAAQVDERQMMWKKSRALLARGQLGPGLAALGKLAKVGGDGYDVQMAIAEAYRGLGQQRAAGSAWARAHAFAPHELEPLVRLAHLARDSDDPVRESELLARAMDIDAMSLDPAARNLAISLVLGNRMLAERSVARCLEIAPLHPVCLAGLAWSIGVGNHSGEQRRAANILDEALLSMSPDAVEAQMVAAHAALVLNRKPLADQIIGGLLSNASVRGPLRRELSAVMQAQD